MSNLDDMAAKIEARLNAKPASKKPAAKVEAKRDRHGEVTTRRVEPTKTGTREERVAKVTRTVGKGCRVCTIFYGEPRKHDKSMLHTDTIKTEAAIAALSPSTRRIVGNLATIAA